jgi:hypothetical protein
MSLIHTKGFNPYDYGEAINEKLASMGWSADQHDLFLDWLHQEKPIDALVAALLTYAPMDWIKGEADAIGVFDLEEGDTQ